jgi:chromate transporter
MPPETPPAPSFREALRYWTRLGFINFGGPAGQIAIMHRDLVVRKRWISEEGFLHALNFCMLLPGPEAQQLATYVGWRLHGTPGGLAAGIFFVLPSAFLLLGLSTLYALYGRLAPAAAILTGLKAVVVAIVVEAVWRIGRRALHGPAGIAIAAAAFLAIFLFGLPFPLIVLAAGAVGFVLPGLAGEQPAPTPPPLPHRAASRRRLAATAAAGLALWSLPFAILVALRGPGSLHVHEYTFFTQAALVTFGGAYAVLAYVTQAAAGAFGWITHAQAVDGMGLAETTPGPLIMVLQFVGFLAAWRHPEGMTPLGSGILGAAVTTYATFLPSILFILLGAPYIEVLRGRRKLSAALSGITAAVVGVILNLALVFGAAALFPEGFPAGGDAFALAVCAASLVALFAFRVDLLWLVAAGAVAGLLRFALV